MRRVLTLALVCAVAILSLLLGGCGGGGGGGATGTSADRETGGGGGGGTPVQTANVAINFQLLKAVPEEVTHIRFTGRTSGQQVVYQSTQQKASQIVLQGVPVSVVELLMEYLDGTGAVVGATQETVALVEGQLLTIDDPEFFDQATYVGSETCRSCHPTHYADFRQTGHPYKVTKVVNGQKPVFPFSDIGNALAMLADNGETNLTDQRTGAVLAGNGTKTDNQLGIPTSYSQVSYVIGGYGWKARFMDLAGYIVTGSKVQYNLDTQAMAAYNDNKTNFPFNCGVCHTTGWKDHDPALNNARQDNLAGIDGTFAAAGVQCEACHGAGGLHAQTRSRSHITRIAEPRTKAELMADDMAYGKPVSCGECHTRDGERPYPTYTSPAETAGYTGEGGRIIASGGLIQHHEQFDEVLAINPDNVAAGSTRSNPTSVMWRCETCHDPHKPTIYNATALRGEVRGRTGGGPGVRGTNDDCLVCHQGYSPRDAVAPHNVSMGHLNCIDCHMPRTAKSAVSKNSGGASPVPIGDIRSHVFTINVNRADANSFTADGKYQYHELTSRFACKQCHDGVNAHDRTTVSEAGFQFHP